MRKEFIRPTKSLKASAGDGRSLCQRLSSFLLGYRTTDHATTGVSPCQLLQGRDLRTRLSLLRPDREKVVLDRQAKQKSGHDRRAKTREWIVGDRVLVRNHREGPDWIPATIIEVLGPVTYIVETEQGYKWKRHADQIKDWLNAVCPVAPESSENVSEDLDVTAEVEGDPPADVVEPAADPFVVDPVEEAGPPPSPVEETAPPSTDQTVAVLPPTSSSRRYPARDRQPPTRYNPSLFGTHHIIVC